MNFQEYNLETHDAQAN